MHLRQELTVFIAVGHYTICNVILLFLIFRISTHFRLLVSEHGKSISRRDQVHILRLLFLYMCHKN
jgi:hypothetical protein